MLKLRSFTIGKKGLPDSIFTDEDGQDKIGEIIRAMVGFVGQIMSLLLASSRRRLTALQVTFLNDIVMPDPNLDDTDSSSDEDEEVVEDDDDEGDD